MPHQDAQSARNRFHAKQAGTEMPYWITRYTRGPERHIKRRRPERLSIRPLEALYVFIFLFQKFRSTGKLTGSAKLERHQHVRTEEVKQANATRSTNTLSATLD